VKHQRQTHDILQNMIKQIIPADYYRTRKVFQKDGESFLNISEFYYDTIQGEGINIGIPSAFLRLQGCIMNCSYCDTNEVWKYGTPWSFKELIQAIDKSMLPERLLNGQHLVITGGSPLFQQDRLIAFLNAFSAYYGFIPFIEIENECTIMPNKEMLSKVDCWDNSPKLKSSGMPIQLRYNKEILRTLSEECNSWFKFVISKEEEWKEIEDFFLNPGLIEREQIFLMPEGATRRELEAHREMVVEMAVNHGVTYCSREHIVLWDKKIGV
jgi:7-carboxy-7-deazaguanine synthase